MSWIAKRLGNGLYGLVDGNDPANPPQIAGAPLNNIIAAYPEGIAAAAVYTVGYVPATTAKIRRLVVSSTGLARIDVLFGTTGAQVLKWRVYTTLEDLTYELPFLDYLPINNTQTFQVNAWNVTGSSQNFGITIEINEPT